MFLHRFKYAMANNGKNDGILEMFSVDDRVEIINDTRKDREDDWEDDYAHTYKPKVSFHEFYVSSKL